MIKKILLFILLILLFTFSCSNNSIKNIFVTELPNKVNYYINDSFEIEGLEVSATYQNGDIIPIIDYEINIPSFVIGKNEINITYLDFKCSFYITCCDVLKIELNELVEYNNYSSKALNNQKVLKTINNVKDGGSRGTNQIVLYNEINCVNRNIYGYEIAIDQYGIVVDKNTNVELPENGYVLSAHGIAKDFIKTIELDDIIFYEKRNHKITVYRDTKIAKYMPLCIEMERIVNEINEKNYDDNSLYNEDVKKINELIPLFNDAINLSFVNPELNVLLKKLQNISINRAKEENIHEMKYTLIEEDNFSITYNPPKINDFVFEEEDIISDIKYGNFRNVDTFVYYCEDNYRTRNSFGYEVAVDENGIVIAKDTLVDLPDGGFILSGIGETGDYLINKIELGNILIYDKTNNTISVRKNYYYCSLNQFYKDITILKDKIILQNTLMIPLDYQYISELFKESVTEYNELFNLISLTETLYNKQIIEEKIERINELLIKISFLLIEENGIEVHSIWYYPFSNVINQDDTTKAGIEKILDLLVSMNINTVYLDCNCQGGYSIFSSKLYKIYPKIEECSYDEYSDYLSCFIGEAHKRNIVVGAFTQTFMYHTNGLKVSDESWYQIDFNGDKSKGNVYYYDICNDNIQDSLLGWYSEISSYNFDVIEYDIIRYPSSNLNNYNNVEVISNKTNIIDHGYTDYTMKKFMDLYSLSGDLHELIINSKDVRQKWMDFKEQELISFITRASEIIRNNNEDVKITAAVLSSYDLAKNNFLQNYPKWIELGILDSVEIMAYTSSTNELQSLMHLHQDLVDKDKIVFGISPKLSIDNIIIDAEQISMICNDNILGYMLFSSSQYLTDSVFIEGMKNNHQITTLSPLIEVDKKYSQINEILLLKIEYFKLCDNYDYSNLIYSIENNDITININKIIELINKIPNELIKRILLNEINVLIN